MPSIRERQSTTGETTWAVLFRQGTKQRSRTFKTAKAAEKFVAMIDLLGVERALVEVEEPARQQGITVDELAAQFLDWKAGDGLTPRSLADYRRDYKNWIQPRLGHREAELVDEGDVQRWVDWMRPQLAPKSIGDRHMLLHQIYKFGRAKSRKLVSHNPCDETDLPKAMRKPPKGATLAEWRAIVRYAETYNPDAADLVRFLGATGWRWSEAAALAVRDVEDDGVNVWVDVTRVFRIVDNRQVLVESAAKSWAGFRRLRMTAEVRSMLRRRIVGKSPSDFVFTNSRGRHWNQNTFLRNTWPALLKGAEVGTPDRKPTPHWLRHMAVASFAKANIPMHEIQRMIGHEDVKTTNTTYGGMVTTLSDESLHRLDEVLAGREVASAIVPGEVVTLIQELDP